MVDKNPKHDRRTKKAVGDREHYVNDEKDVVVFSDAVVEPDTVVVEVRNANPTFPAVDSSSRFEKTAKNTKFDFFVFFVEKKGELLLRSKSFGRWRRNKVGVFFGFGFELRIVRTWDRTYLVDFWSSLGGKISEI